MHTPTASTLLNAWEQGHTDSPVSRALALLSATCPDEPADAIARQPIGERDRGLLMLRQALFGPQMEGVAACPACGERLELTVGVAELLAQAPDEPSAAGGHEPDGHEAAGAFALDGYEIRYRLPDSLDLLEASGIGDPSAVRRALLSRCVLEATAAGQPVTATDLPERVAHGLAEALAQADPLGDIELALACPACGREWVAPFDIAGYLWAEVDDWAKRLLRDVHTLASAYGWREADILALSPWRRQAYLDLIAGA
jgi:hypothetical protein